MTAPATVAHTGKKALFVSKWPQRWNELFLAKFRRLYHVDVLRIHERVRAVGYARLAGVINAEIERGGAEVVLLDIEFYQGFGLDILTGLTRRAKLVLVTFDDIVFHEFNATNARACDLVLCADPLAVLKYREKNIPAALCLLENSVVPFVAAGRPAKDIDVLFFGDLSKGGRREFVADLSARGVPVTVHAPEIDGELSYDALARLIARARIVLNLSKTHAIGRPPDAVVPVDAYLQFKGRVVEAGLGQALCVSEYAPGVEYLFGTDRVPMFRTVEECARIVKGLLADPAGLARAAAALHETVMTSCEETVQLAQVGDAIERATCTGRAWPDWVPVAYLRTLAVARFLRIRPGGAALIRDFGAFLTNRRLGSAGARVSAAIALLPEIVKMLLSLRRRRAAT